MRVIDCMRRKLMPYFGVYLQARELFHNITIETALRRLDFS